MSILTLAATLAVALGALGLAVASPGNPELAASLTASGALGLTSTRDGETLFSASLMRPGQPPARGTLTVTNTGEAPEILVLRASDIVDQPGLGGGKLSTRVELTVSDVTAAAPVELWSGRPAELTAVRLALLAVGESRALEVAAALPSAGNADQGASLALGLTWGVSRASGGAGTPAATPMATPTPTPRPIVPPIGTAAAVDVAADQLGLPSAGRCVNRRRFKLRLRAPHRGRIARVAVRVGRQPAKRIRGRSRRKVAVPVNLRSVRTRRFTVRIEVRTTDSHRYRSKRTYRICGA
jgi:hypothetical protein